MIGQMRQTIFDDSKLTLFQAAINDQFSQVSQIPFINGVRLSSISLTNGVANTVDTSLGRKASGYMIILKDANADVWNDSIESDSQITLWCSADVTIDLWVF
jgi:hypothetical protein